MKSIKKLLGRTLLYLFIILLIPYLYFIFQAKQAIDTFLSLHPVDGKFEYQWFWVDLGGKITLQNVQFFQDSHDAIFTAEKIEVIPTSLFDLLDIKEHLIYQEYPSQIIINLINGETKQATKVFSLFNVLYQPDYLNYFYSKKCLTSIDPELPFMHFNLSSKFVVHRTSDDSLISFHFNSKEFAKVSGSFTLNNFSEHGEGGNFVSDLSIQFSNLLWMQQNTQKCLQALNIEKQAFSSLHTEFLFTTAKKNNLLLSNDAAKVFVDFIFVPQKIELNFDLQEGKTFSQIPLLPIYKYQQQVGLTVKLNGTAVRSFFQAYDYIAEKGETVSSSEENKTSKTPPNKFITLDKRSLKSYLGAKIKITLYNNKKVVGYLDRVNYQSIKIYQLELKGRTILPFSLKDIKSVILLREAN